MQHYSEEFESRNERGSERTDFPEMDVVMTGKVWKNSEAARWHSWYNSLSTTTLSYITETRICLYHNSQFRFALLRSLYRFPSLKMACASHPSGKGTVWLRFAGNRNAAVTWLVRFNWAVWLISRSTWHQWAPSSRWLVNIYHSLVITQHLRRKGAGHLRGHDNWCYVGISRLVNNEFYHYWWRVEWLHNHGLMNMPVNIS